MPGQRATRNTLNPPTDDNAVDSMLRYYDPQWQTVLRDGKNIFRYGLASDDPYVDPAKGYKEAEESLTEALANYRSQGGTITGLYLLHTTYRCSQNILDDVITNGMKKMAS